MNDRKLKRLLEYLGYYAFTKKEDNIFLSWKELNLICSWLKVDKNYARQTLKSLGLQYNNRGIYINSKKIKLL